MSVDIGVQEAVVAAGQGHIFNFINQLDEATQFKLISDVQEIDWVNLDQIKQQVFVHLDRETKNLKPALKIKDSQIEELPKHCQSGTDCCDSARLDEYKAIGHEALKQGKVAALLLAGGQGTRLGVQFPKGMLDVGLPSKKTLFHLQAERIKSLCKKVKPTTTGGDYIPIIWYVMTSEATTNKTKIFFEENDYFGLGNKNVVFFEQGKVPCFDFDGKLLLEEKYKIAKSPDGNGGLYGALYKNGIIDHMTQRGVEFVHVYCVDNILVRVCDPVFIGYCLSKQADVGAKVVEKVSPDETVGTICKVDGRFKVIEYSEISYDIASRRDPQTNKLAFSAGNICEHFFKVDYLRTIDNNRQLRYHLAIKKIPHISLETGDYINPTSPNGIKLEKFIFDVFEFTDKLSIWAVKREDEFAPIKNADGTKKDNPTTAREALLRSYELGLLTC